MGLIEPRDGVRYTWEEPHPYISKASDEYGQICEVCGVQPRDRHPYPGPHAFKAYLDYGWRKCVHCGEQRVNMQHPTEEYVMCPATAFVGSILSLEAVTCTLNMERYPDHTQHSGSIPVYDASGERINTAYIGWRTRDLPGTPV